MKEPEKICILLFVLSFNIISASHKFENLPLYFDCNDEYECSTGAESPFPLGKHYVYSYNVFATIEKMERLEGSKFDQATSEYGSLKITPINSCKFVASLEPENFKDIETPSIKVIFDQGKIQHICSSQKNPAQLRINTLKSVISTLLQITSKISLNKSSIQENETVKESTSMGACLTKYSYCYGSNNDTLIKYQSSQNCGLNGEESDLLKNTHIQVEDFNSAISKFSENVHQFCESSDFTQENKLDVPEGLAICSMKRVNGIINTLKCAESFEIESYIPKVFRERFYNAVYLRLKEEVSQTTLDFSHKTKFFKTSIYQVNTQKQREDRVHFLLDQFRYALSNLVNSSSSLSEKEKHVNILRSLIRVKEGYENIIQVLHDFTHSSTSSRASKIILMIFASEANDENVMKIVKTIFTNDLLVNKLTEQDMDKILQKIILANSNPATKSSKGSLQFSQFLFSYVHNSTKKFSDQTKLNALIAYSNHLDEFCNKMELLIGERYCSKMSLIRDSPVVEILPKAEGTHEEIMLLEAISNFQHHENDSTSCTELHKLRKGTSIGLWSVLNCYRKRPCHEEGKQFFRELIQDKISSSNVKIAAFLAMRRCFNDKDRDEIKILFETLGANAELLAFIKGYRLNREVSGSGDPLFSLPMEKSIAVGTTKDDSSKTATASNTFALFKIPIPYSNIKLQLETNMMYFEKPTMIPELIILSLSTNERNVVRRVLEVEIFVDDLQKSGTYAAFEIKITMIIRRFSTTVFIKEYNLSKESLMRLIHSMQISVQNSFFDGQANTFVQKKLKQWIKSIINVDIFDFQSILQGHTFFSTISGIPYEIYWNLDAFTSLQISKNDCSDLFFNNGNSNCSLVMKPEINLEGQSSCVVASGSALDKRNTVEGNIFARFPIRLDLFRNEGEEGAFKEFVKLTLPSVYSSIVKLKTIRKEIEGETVTNSTLESLDLGMQGVLENSFSLHEESPHSFQVLLYKDRKTNTLKATVTDENFEVSLESKVTDENYGNVKGNLTFHKDSFNKSYIVEVGFQNVKDSKKLKGLFFIDGQEYSFAAYFNRDIKNQDLNHHHGLLSCGGRIGSSILCVWPFCAFCGTEYFIGATVNTPQFKNVKIFEVSVTQIFPRKKINFILKSEGIPILGKTEVKISLSRGNDTMIVANPKVRDTINEKLKNILSSPHLGTGDALPESVSMGGTHSLTIYSVDTKIFSDLLKQSDATFTFLSFLTHEQSKFASRLFCGEILYPSRNKGHKENLSYLSSLIYPDKMTSNSQSEALSETRLRSSHFPVINFDLNGQHKRIDSFLEKTFIVFKPLNLIRGQIKVEIANYGRKDNGESLLSMSSWDNIYFNRTYKVFLPDPSKIKILKGRVTLNRVDRVLHTAGVEAFIGVDDALEVKYDFHPEQNNAFEVLTSVTTDGETYGLFHHIEPVGQSQRHLHDGSVVNEDNEIPSPGFAYTGTYVIGERSWKATGLFQASMGREILPFSKFSIRLKAVEGEEMAIRVFGAESVHQEKIHNITMTVNMGNISVFAFINEINPFDDIPIKANVFVKDYGEITVLDSSKFVNKRNLQLKGRWYPQKKLIQGEIAFPTSLSKSPLYLDVDVTVAEETDNAKLLHLNSESTINVMKNFSVNTNNVITFKNNTWESGLNGLYTSSDYDDETFRFKYLKIFSFSIYHILPDFKKYAFEILNHQYLERHFGSHYIHTLKIHRPHVKPFHISANLEMKEIHESEMDFEGDGVQYNTSTTMNETITFKACHEDNFLYIFPHLKFDFDVIGQREYYGQQKLNAEGIATSILFAKLTCQSKGTTEFPFCNLLNVTATLDSERQRYTRPWLVNMKIANSLETFYDEFTMNMTTVYEPVKQVTNESAGHNEDYDSIPYMLMNTVNGEKLLRNRYNIEYQLARNFRERSPENDQQTFGMKGTYIFTKMYESWDFFELTDHHKWNSINCEDFHIWTNVINHTSADANSEVATFSSQYVSLGESTTVGSSYEGSAKNITWMELRTTLSINGFGTLKSFVEQPSSILNCYEGNIEADFLVRTEFSPVKALRLMVSHENSKSEIEDDDASKLDADTKFNAVLNDFELSGSNSFTILLGKLLSVGNSFTGRFGSVENNYEYRTLKVFAILPGYFDCEGDNLLHFDVSSSLTNSEDDETDIRMVNDVIYNFPVNSLPTIRFMFMKNSTDFDLERNISVIVYQDVSKEVRSSGIMSRLPFNIISDSLSELSLTQSSIQSLAQQIIDDYYNATYYLSTESISEDNHHEQWPDYNFELLSRYDFQDSAANIFSSTKWFGFEQKVFHCQSVIDVCHEYVENVTNYRIDTSNYCNLLLLPIKPALYILL